MTVAVLTPTKTNPGRHVRGRRLMLIGGSVLIHGLLLPPLMFLTARPPLRVVDASPAPIYLEIEPRPLLPEERPRQPTMSAAPAAPARTTGQSRPGAAPTLAPALPTPPAPRIARPAPDGTPATASAQTIDPWRVTPESQAAATARVLRTSPAGCRAYDSLSRAEQVLCDEQFNERAAAAAERRPITGTGDAERDARFAREGARELQRYEAQRRPLGGGVGVLAPQDCPGSNFGTGCAGAHLDSSMQMDSNRNIQTRREGPSASGRPMTPGAAGPREPMRPH